MAKTLNDYNIIMCNKCGNFCELTERNSTATTGILGIICVIKMTCDICGKTSEYILYPYTQIERDYVLESYGKAKFYQDYYGKKGK